MEYETLDSSTGQRRTTALASRPFVPEALSLGDVTYGTDFDGQESASYFAATLRLPDGRCCEAEYAPIALKRGSNSLHFPLEREAGFTCLERSRAVSPLPGNTQFC